MAVDVATLGIKLDPDGFSRGAAVVRRGMDQLASKSRRVGIQIGQNFRSLVRGLLNIRTALAGLIVGFSFAALIRNFIRVAAEVEGLEVRLQTLLGSVAQGTLLFDELIKIAKDLPFTLQETQRAATTLATVIGDDVDEIIRWTQITADLAAAFGLTFEIASQQMVRAMSAGIASADLFRERGVSAFLGFQTGVTISAEETRKRIIDEWEKTDSGFRGATDRLARTWDGLLSQLSDKWFIFRLEVSRSGPFQFLRAAIGELNDFLNTQFGDITEAGRSFGKNMLEVMKNFVIGTAEVLDAIAPAFNVLFTVFNQLLDGFNKLPDWMKTGGLVGAMLFGRIGLGVLAGISGLASLPESFREINRRAESGESLTGKEIQAYLRAQMLPEDQAGPRIIPPEGVPDTIFEAIKAESNFADTVRGTIAAIEARVAADEARIVVEDELRQKLIESAGEEEKKKELTDEQTEALTNYNALLTDYARETALAADATEAQTIQYEVQSGALQALNDKQKQTIQTRAEEITELRKQRDIARDFSREIGDAFTDIATSGDSFSDSIKRMTAALIQLAFQRFIIDDLTRSLESLFSTGSSAGSSALGGLLSSLLGSVTGLFTSGGGVAPDIPGDQHPPLQAQHGGTFGARQPLIVGEAGPELFVPRTAGTIIPNHALAGGITISNVVDARGADAGAELRLREAMRQTSDITVRRVRDEIRRGGPLSRLVRS